MHKNLHRVALATYDLKEDAILAQLEIKKVEKMSSVYKIMSAEHFNKAYTYFSNRCSKGIICKRSHDWLAKIST